MIWSQIQYTELATEAFVLMNENEIAGCSYHNNRHITEMYLYLENVGEPYDEALDWAIMFHDVVYDAEPEKELRSAKLFLEMIEQYPRGFNLNTSETMRAYDLILSTASHKVLSEETLPGNSAIIRADLHELVSKVKTINNFTKIMNESLALYGCSIEEFATNNISFMSQLHSRIAINMLNVNTNQKLFFHAVQKGIDLTIRMAQAIKDIKEI
jgi:predicted metal-dependent HD superfamily phosphohydrolase